MIKRVFILFFCIAQILVFTLLGGQSVVSYEHTNADYFSPYIESASEAWTYNSCKNIYHLDVPVIRTDDCKWKENLKKLLRHRHSSFRLKSFASLQFAYTCFESYFKDGIRSLKAVSLYKSKAILPGYYSFLHRLCPF